MFRKRFMGQYFRKTEIAHRLLQSHHSAESIRRIGTHICQGLHERVTLLYVSNLAT